MLIKKMDVDLFIGMIMSFIVLSSCNSGGETGENIFGIRTSPDISIDLLSITPATEFLRINETLTFRASGGALPYRFSLNSGVGSVTEAGVYTAASVAGIAVIRVVDNENREAFATVTIGDAVLITPNNVVLGQGEGQLFSASGGIPPYQFQIIAGSGSIDVSSGLFTAPNSSGNTIVEATDSAGNKAFSVVTTNQTLEISPTTISVGTSENVNFSTSGGTLPYTYSILVGGGSISATNGIFSSPATPQTVTVRVTDINGLTSDSTVTVINRPRLNQTSFRLATGSSFQFTTTEGTAPFSYSVVSGGGSINSSTGLFTAGNNIETTTIQVSDQNGFSDQATINIFKTPDLSLSQYVTCVTSFTSDTTSTLKCIGGKASSFNDRGYLGQGNSDYFIGDTPSELGDSISTIDIGTGLSIRGIETGFETTCALLTDNRVKCFGTNFNGMLHNGSNNINHRGYTTNQMGDNLSFINLGTGRTVKSGANWKDYFDMYFRHVCVILDNDELRCWGLNSSGQLGLGDTNSRGDNLAEVGDGTPNVNLGGDVPVQVATGSNHTCVRLSNGNVKCWGEASRGQLGQGNETDLGRSSGTTPPNINPIDFGTGLTAQKVIAGSEFTCVLASDNSVRCWGQNNFGQLGRGITTTELGDSANEMGDNIIPVNLGNGLFATDIVAGVGFTCALLNSNEVKCWGLNSSGQLGQGNTTNRGRSPLDLGDNLMPVNLGTGRTAVALWANAASVCAKLDNNDVRCWGENGRSQLAAGHRFDIGRSALSLGDNLPVTNISSTADIEFISFSQVHGCGLLSDQTMKCWGEDQLGMRGGEDWLIGDELSELGANLIETNLGTNVFAQSISGYLGSSCALSFSGELRCWGNGAEGALGQGNQTDIGIVTEQLGDNFTPINLGTGRSIESFSVGFNNGCAILDNRDLKCWGRGNDGALGQGSTTDRGDGLGELGDNLAVTNLGTNLQASFVSSGNNFSCAIIDDSTNVNDGKVKCWGRSTTGQLGQGSTASRGDGANEMGDFLAFTDLGTGRTAQSLCTGDEFSCALMDNNQVKCWGRSDRLGLGVSGSDHRGDGPNEMGDNLPEVDFGSGLSVKSLSCGRFHTCAVLSNNQIKCFGLGTNGRLGLGSTATRGDGPGEMGDSLPFVNLGTGRSALAVEAGGSHTCAVLDNADTVCWGQNFYGQLGAGHTFDLGTNPIHMGDNLIPLDLE